MGKLGPGPGPTRRSSAKVVSTDPKQVCLILSPCGKPESATRNFADDICKRLILPAVSSLQLDPKRLDQISPTGDINANLVSLLLSAPLCISVLDQHNPNVMIETGIRLAYDKPIVFLKAFATEIPFDIISRNSIEYDLSSSAKTKQSISKLVKHLKNPAFQRVDAFSTNLDLIGGGYELLPTSRAKLRRLDRFVEDLQEFTRDLDLDTELDSRNLSKRTKTRKSHEVKLISITDRLRHETTLLTAILNECSSGSLKDACESFIKELHELQSSVEGIRKQLFAKSKSTKLALVRSATSLINKSVTMRQCNGHADSSGNKKKK